MAFEPITQKRTVDVVAERLEENILNGTLGIGDMLPSEAQLAAQFGVGRRSIREALKALEMKGLLEIRTGVGSIVKRNDLGSFLSELTKNVRYSLGPNKADARHVAEFRLLLEGAGVERLATNPKNEIIQQLTEAVQEQRKAVSAQDFDAYQDWHLKFHHAIVEVLENPVVSMIHEQTLALMRTPMEEVGRHPGVTTQTIEEHEQILSEIKRGSISDAKTLLAKHLDHFLAYLDELKVIPRD